MIQNLQFDKTKQIQETINHALQSIEPTNGAKTSESIMNSKQKLETLQKATYISLDDAQFIINLLNETHGHHHKHYVHELLSASSVYKPPPKISKNPKFEEFMQTLRAKQAKKDYQKLINSDKPSAHQKSVLSTIKGEHGVQQWLDYTSIGHLVMIMFGSFLVFFYLAHHVWPNSHEYKLVAGCIGLLLGLMVEFALMVIKEQKAELEATSKNPTINMEMQHLKYNKKSIQKVIDAQKTNTLENEKTQALNNGDIKPKMS